MKIYKATTEKLKELKTWAQVKSPKPLQPVLSYALDWLSPELLGTGFRLFEVDEFEIKGVIPANSSNLDFQKEVHQGLVTNAALEMARVFLQRQMPESFFQITASEMHLSKKQKWNEEIRLELQMNQPAMDEFFISLQKTSRAQVKFDFTISSAKFRKQDSLELKLTIESTPLIA